MKITDLKARTVLVPLEAPLRHSTGVHPGRFIRTILEVFTDEGIVGLGEVGGGDQRGALMKLKPRVVGEDPFNLERIKQKTLRQIYYLSNARLYAALEVACLDIQGKATGRPVSDLIGGRLRDRVPFSAYLFYRYRDGDAGGETTPDEMVRWTRALIEEHGFRSAKLKCGVIHPDNDVAVMHALREAFGPQFGLRLDPNGIWSRGTAIDVAKRLEDCRLEYLEDPTWGLEGMARVKERTSLPLATNMCVTHFDHVAPAVAMNAVDVILSDIYYWEGVRGVKALGVLCECFRWGLSMHSGSELGVTLAAMLHTAAALPNLTYDVDAHYHHLLDDVIVGGKMKYVGGCIDVPTGPGLGVELDEDRMGRYSELFEKEGDYYARFHEDTRQPDWFPINPQW
jgi:glucarate dehydratase